MKTTILVFRKRTLSPLFFDSVSKPIIVRTDEIGGTLNKRWNHRLLKPWVSAAKFRETGRLAAILSSGDYIAFLLRCSLKILSIIHHLLENRPAYAGFACPASLTSFPKAAQAAGNRFFVCALGFQKNPRSKEDT